MYYELSCEAQGVRRVVYRRRALGPRRPGAKALRRPLGSLREIVVDMSETSHLTPSRTAISSARGARRASTRASKRRHLRLPLYAQILHSASVFSPSCRYTSRGFVIGGVEHQGNVFLYQELSLLWAVENLEDVTPDALIAAHAINPPPDLLIVGCGDKIGTLPKATLQFFHDTETTLEVLDTVRSRTLPGLSVAPADT